MSSKTLDEIISTILVELNLEQAEYQRLYRKIYGDEDGQARQVYKLQISLCDRIRREAMTIKKR